jgi:hypothetical protein
LWTPATKALIDILPMANAASKLAGDPEWPRVRRGTLDTPFLDDHGASA